jgi:hypothetical protein
VVIVLFHSMFGLRAVELVAAEQLRGGGHRVVVPDLFDGATVPDDLDAGFALTKSIGWDTIVARARRAVAGVPEDAVLGGFSMGVGVIGELWPMRLEAAAVFCLHARPSCLPVCAPALRSSCMSEPTTRSPLQIKEPRLNAAPSAQDRMLRCTDTPVSGTSSPTHRSPTTTLQRQPRRGRA